MTSPSKTALITGFPTTLLARRVIIELLSREPSTELLCVVQERAEPKASAWVADLETAMKERIRFVFGDVAAIDLGLSGAEFRSLTRQVDLIHHCAAITYLAAPLTDAEAVNVQGAREIVEFASACTRLERLVYWSTALVSGTRSGRVREDDVVAPTGFRSPVEETRYRGERIASRASEHVPVTILRPSIVVGDSLTGEIDRFDGPYLSILLALNSPVDLRLPIPTNAENRVNLVPIDFVVKAGCTAGESPRALSKTLHLVDHEPLTVRELFDAIARSAGRPQPRFHVPTRVASALLKTPGIKRFAKIPRGFLDLLATDVVYDDSVAREVLEPYGLRCPPFQTYVDVLVDFVRKHRADKKARASNESEDPLA